MYSNIICLCSYFGTDTPRSSPSVHGGAGRHGKHVLWYTTYIHYMGPCEHSVDIYENVTSSMLCPAEETTRLIQHTHQNGLHNPVRAPPPAPPGHVQGQLQREIVQCILCA